MPELTFCHPVPFCQTLKSRSTIDESIILKMRTETTDYVGKGSNEMHSLINRGHQIMNIEKMGFTHKMQKLSDRDLLCLNTASTYDLFKDIM